MKLSNPSNSKNRSARCLLFALMLFIANTSFAADYFIDSVSGNNANSGLTINSPWKDLSFINSKTFSAGTNIYLKCGSVWNGQQLKFSGSGTSTSPIRIDKYGIGAIPILNGNGLIGEGVVYLFNQQYIEINNLEITNAPNGALDSDFFVGINNGTINNNPLGADRRGVMVVIDDYGVANHIYLKNLNIHHVKGQLGNSVTSVNGAIPKRTGGVYFAVLNEASTSNSRFNDVLIDGCSVNYCENIGIAFDNEDNVYYPGGTEYTTWYARRFSNVKISNNTIHHIGKNAMIIRCTDETGLIERNVCYETALGTTGNTIMSSRAKGTVFQYNEGYFNRGTTQTVDPGTVDGSMYDPDYGSIGIIFQYSYSHDNSEGLYWGCNTRSSANNTTGIPDPEDVGCTLRYNISQNDMGDLIFFNYPSAGNEIYNNVFYIKSGINANIIHESSTKNHTYNFYNNIIYNLSTTAKYAFGSGTGIQNRTIENNLFYGNHPSTEPSDINKLVTDPLFVNPGIGGVGFASLGGYRLQENSPAISSGKIIANNGGYDFYNTTISVTKNPNRGVFEGTEKPVAANQTFCGTTNPTVANLVATGTALKWYSASAGGIALATTTPLATGIYYVSQTLNAFESERIPVSITVNLTVTPTANAQTFCNSGTVANLMATGMALQWYSVATDGTALVSTSALASGTYYVSQTVNACEGPRTAVNVTVNITTAPGANAQTFCNSGTVANLVATGTALQWYSISSGGTALASTTVLVSGTYYVSQTLNSCEGPRTSVAVTINTTAAPTANAQTFCNSATVSSLVATGTALQWYLAATGGTALASTTAIATGTYYVSQTLNSCEGPRTPAAITVNVTAAPIANAQSFCNSGTVVNLVAIGTALKWYSVATGGSGLASTTALTSATYYVSQTVNSCEGPRTAVNVTVNVTPAPTASAQTFCNSATVSNLVATGTALQWYSVSTGGTALASTVALASGTYYVSQTLNSCQGPRTSVAVTINTTAAPTANAQTFCNSATVSNLVATGTALKWYSVATGGTALASTSALATGTYYVSQTVNACEGPRKSVAVTVNITLAPTANAQAFCSSSNPKVSNLVATGTAIKWYSVATGGTALTSTTSLVTGTYYASQTVNSCESLRIAVAVKISAAAKVTNIIGYNTSTTKACINTIVTLSYASGSVGNPQWMISETLNGTYTDILGATNPTYDYIPTLAKIVYFKVRMTNPPCTTTATSSSGVPVYSKTCSIAREKQEDIFPFKAIAYPNPFNHNFKIKVTSSSASPLEIKIYDMIGKLIEIANLNSSEIETKDFGNNLAAGIYTIVIAQDSNIAQLRLIKR